MVKASKHGDQTASAERRLEEGRGTELGKGEREISSSSVMLSLKNKNQNQISQNVNICYREGYMDFFSLNHAV